MKAIHKGKKIYGLLLLGMLLLGCTACSRAWDGTTKETEGEEPVTESNLQGTSATSSSLGEGGEMGNAQAEGTPEEGTAIQDASQTASGSAAAGGEQNERAAYTIVIDAGHQKEENTKNEAIGPGASEKKAKVSAGRYGVQTGMEEYKINLKVAKKLERILQKKGYNVVMVRSSNDVNISNKKRAKIANQSGDIFIRLHCDYVEDSEEKGVLAVCPTADNPFPIRKKFSECESLSYAILNRVCKKTGAENRGVLKTDYMTGINYSKIPVALIEMGCLSNAEEDVLLSKAGYQKKIAKGIAKGLDDFLEIARKK